MNQGSARVSVGTIEAQSISARAALSRGHRNGRPLRASIQGHGGGGYRAPVSARNTATAKRYGTREAANRRQGNRVLSRLSAIHGLRSRRNADGEVADRLVNAA